MENFNHLGQQEAAAGHRGGTGSFLYSGSVLTAPPSYDRTTTPSAGNFHLQPYDHPVVKTEAGITNTSHHTQSFEGEDEAIIKAKIISHPQYSNLLEAYMDCQKVGAPPEVAARLGVVRQEFESQQRDSILGSRDISSKDPELDQFMEAYYDMLVKYREELTRPLQEAMEFLRRIESQLNMLSNGPVRAFNSSDEKCEGVGSSEEDQDNHSAGETELTEIDPRAEDRELKNHLLRKYSGYLSSLKQELSKKKKKGKLPKEARQKLLSWWELHYKWPYPSETEKVALAESTGLDQKQINNWFINQRKRHWKPSEDMQFMVMDGLHPQNAVLYMDSHYMGDSAYRMGP
ncbi:unnamed protein product [Cuscuta europaea]|uniref:Uncharacterized protein n=1 Tax=Cuscuta europaea TaxID=41803 RepID=A0A9P0YWR7_CUSEU|nr:unnamed protein product [Cuscuta europaea]